ncbi:MAG: 3-oxoacyl-ACP reductase FabG [Planctomycetes bacterium]|nr:3-oxoacyl-ACP reductase FabG [Planctomycetota bacterium]
MDLHLKDKVALVTGGSRGLGRAICLAFAAEGARVVVNYRRSADRAAEVVGLITERFGVDALAVAADVSREADILDMYRLVEERFGHPDVLVNNAAVLASGPVTSYTEQEWNRIFQVNVTGAFLATREFVRRLLAAGRSGRIVNIVSQAAFLGSTSGHLPYDSSKGALVSFTRALARELAPKGIAVNAVAPGMIRTEMVAARLAEHEEKYTSRIPLHRIATPEDIAGVVVFLASDVAGYMTGTTLDVTGGMMMR